MIRRLNIIVKNFLSMYRFFFVFFAIIFSVSVKGQSFTDIKAGLTGVSESACNWIDYNEDGAPDIFVTGDFYNNSGHKVLTKLYKNLRNNRFAEVPTYVVNINRGDFDWGDYNNDGIEDLFITGENSKGNVVSYLYKGNRTNQFSVVPVHITGYRDGSVEWGDYDGDGDLDILIVGDTKDGPQSSIYRNNRDNTFSKIKAGFPGVTYGTGRWCDYDNDGDLDVLISGNESSGIVFTALYKNDKGSFIDQNIGFKGLKLNDAAWGDYDNDGDEDLVIVGESQNGSVESRLYRNNGTGGFSQVFPGFMNVRSGSVDWGDMDHDGDLDLLLTGESANGPVSKVYRNDRNGGFYDIHADITGLYMSDGRWGDYDNDGDLDAVVSGMSQNYQFISRVYRNDPVHTDTVIDKSSENIWNNTVVVYPGQKNIYYYVFASCYCDFNGDGSESYNVFFSPVKKQTRLHQLQEEFNRVIRKTFPNWVEFDQAYIIENGFVTIANANESKRIAIDEYKSSGFSVHELNW